MAEAAEIPVLPVPGTSATFAARVFSKIDFDGDCWEWTRANNDGYGVIGKGGRGAGTMEAHRAVWMLLVGPIPPGLTLDHLCRNHACVNPDHLEVVTLEENKRRGYSPARIHASRPNCPKGHPKDGVTKRKDGSTERYCKTCARANANAQYAKKKERKCPKAL